MKLRKSAKLVRSRADLLTDVQFIDEIPLDRNSAKKMPQQSGIYVVGGTSERGNLYAGEASNLRQRIEIQFGDKTRPVWWGSESLTARYFPTTCARTDRLAYRYLAIVKHQPQLNFPNQTNA